jgi:hypothetical protein
LIDTDLPALRGNQFVLSAAEYSLCCKDGGVYQQDSLGRGQTLACTVSEPEEMRWTSP